MAEQLEDEVSLDKAKKSTKYKIARDNARHRIKALYFTIFIFMSVVSLVYGIISFNRPELLEIASDNPTGTLSMLFGLGAICSIFASIAISTGDASFERFQPLEPKLDSYGGTYSRLLASTFELMSGAKLVRESAEKPERLEEVSTEKYESHSYGASSDDTPFEKYISDVIRSITAYANNSELTAEKLLQNGKSFMKGGLSFYIATIIIWQIFANLTKPDPHVMYIGMAACSITFIVIEFLAAWYFKQYRYYVEVSLSCLRVRSVYDRYLLGYYALKAFKEEGEVEARDKMMEALKEDVKWPTYKGAASNDFNYMMESMGAAHTSLDKIRKIFKDSGKGKG